MVFIIKIDYFIIIINNGIYNNNNKIIKKINGINRRNSE